MITHQVVIWLAPDLVPPGQYLTVVQKLNRYLDDLNVVFAPCHRRFTIAQIKVGFSSFAHPQFSYKALPAVYLHLSKMPAGSENSGSGTAGYDEAGDFHILQGWLKVWDQAENERDYKFQFYVLTHELGHCFGLALGEMYDMRFAMDPLPLRWGPPCHLDWRDPNDSFWSRHKDWLRDPMVSQHLEWSEYHRRVITDGRYRLINPPIPMASTQHCHLQILNAFGQPLENVGVELCRRDSPEFDASARTNVYGWTHDFPYDEASSMALINDLKLLVIQHPGGICKRWISAYEAQERAILYGDQSVWNLGTIVVPYPEGVTPVVIPDEDRLPAPDPPPERPIAQPLPKPNPPKTGTIVSSPSPQVRPTLKPILKPN